jgi:hypothetical protein
MNSLKKRHLHSCLAAGGEGVGLERLRVAALGLL